jgi:hypothetical protein
MSEILLLDFFDVEDSAAELFSSWTNKLHSRRACDLNLVMISSLVLK